MLQQITSTQGRYLARTLGLVSERRLISTYPLASSSFKKYIDVVRSSCLARPQNAKAGSLADVPLLRDVDPLSSRLLIATSDNEEQFSAAAGWIEVRLPFSTDTILASAWSDQETATNSWSGVRFSKFYSMMDALTGDVAMRHAAQALQNVTVVTASHYNSLKLEPTVPDHDLVVRSYPVDVGNSSAQIRTDVWQDDILLHVVHTVMVTVDPTTLKPMKGLPPLNCSGDPECLNRAALAQSHRKAIKENKRAEVNNLPPKPEEIGLVHNLLLEASTGKNDATHWSRDWTFKAFHIVYPEQRNCNGKMFGGWVSSEAYNLAYFTARAFTGQTPVPLGADEMLFHLPVGVGDLLRFTSEIVFTSYKTIRIWVTVELYDPHNTQSRKRKQTNHLKFVFRQPDEGVPYTTKPETYAEILKYLAARRFYDMKGF